MMDGTSQNMNIKSLIKYRIFVLKIIQFGLSFFILLVLPRIKDPPLGHMYCISTGPTLIISLLFIELYICKRVPLFMEKMYLFFQMWFTFGAFIQCFILNLMHFDIWLLYGICYFLLLAALAIDLFLIANERGCTINVA